jgi:excisionase family DNA binding protein
MLPIPSEQTTTNEPHDPLAYRIKDAVRASGLSKSTLYELAAAGKLKLARVGGRTLVPRAELMRLIEGGQRVT